jgi:hypothetical protein
MKELENVWDTFDVANRREVGELIMMTFAYRLLVVFYGYNGLVWRCSEHAPDEAEIRK